MKVLFLNAYFHPESIAFTHLEHDLLSGLTKENHEITVICPSPTRGISKEIAQQYKKIKTEDLYDGQVHAVRFWAPQEGKNPIVRAIRYVWCNLRTYQLAKHYADVDVIFANSTPPTQGMLAGLVKKRLSKKRGKSIPFVFDLQDVFPDSLLNANMTKKGSVIWKIGRKIEDYAYCNADTIITISEDFKNNIVAKGVLPEKVKVIPNWINTDDVQPIDRENNILFERYGLERNGFYICYSGNLGHSQNLPLLIEAAKRLRDELPEVKIILIGEGAEKENLEKKIQAEHLPNLMLLPFQPYEEISHVFSLGDVGFIISKPGIGTSSVPSKTWSIMAAERPILASFDKESQLAKLIEHLQVGVTAPAGDLEALLDAIKLLYWNKKANWKMGMLGRKYVSETISKDKCVGQYIQVMAEVADL